MSSTCQHPERLLSDIQDPGEHGRPAMGVETCTACGWQRRAEGGRYGPWRPPGTSTSERRQPRPEPEVGRFGRSTATGDGEHLDGLVGELLLLVERLRDEREADTAGTDPEWRVREVIQRMLVVVNAMARGLEHNRLDQPEQAVRFVAQTLSGLDIEEVASLLDVPAEMVAGCRDGEVVQVDAHPARVTLVAQLLYELLPSVTARGAQLWFNAPILDGRTPRELLDDDPDGHRQELIALARGGRAQTDRGGARYRA
jgi:hypothetical protein